MTASPPFHLALPVDDLEAARAFYAGTFRCPIGREDTRWIDFDFFGHQITVHLVARTDAPTDTNAVDGDDVPVRHFGVILAWQPWEELHTRLAREGVPFLIAPHVRFRGEVGEQGTFFVKDPAGNAIEIKTFADASRLFAR